MDGVEDYIWRRRIHYGVRHQRGAVPFPESVAIGLEFNAALERKQKLDLSLLTNGVMLELCNFARTVTRSETYFLFEMLEFNFELGVDVDDDVQYFEFARRLHNKAKLLKAQIKTKPHRWKETFPLPDVGALIKAALLKPSGRHYPKRNGAVDTSVLSERRRSTENQEAATPLRKPARSKARRHTNPFCESLGVTLAVGPDDAPREKLDPSLVTNGVMLELLGFSRALCGTLTGIVHDLVELNFGQNFDKLQLRLQVSRLMERKCACLAAADRAAFRKEPFNIQTQRREPRKRRSPDGDCEESSVARRRRDTLRQRDAIAGELELSYMCPVDFDAEMQSDLEVERHAVAFGRSAAPEDVKEEDEEAFISPPQLHANGHDAGLQRTGQKRPVGAGWGLFAEDGGGGEAVKTWRQRLWTRRADRSKEILKCSRVNDAFARCREIGLDFNVGSGRKQNLDPRLLTNCVLWEVHKYAMGMSRSLTRLLFHFLDGNFNLLLQDEIHQRNFLYYVIKKEKLLQNHPERRNAEFLNSCFEFPDVYNMVDVTGEFHTGQEVEPNWDSPAPDEEPHPFCKKLGLNLWSTEARPPSQKLDLTALTSGAVLEMFGFIRELCGTVSDTVNDVLEHNFDVDLRGATNAAAEVIQRWCRAQRGRVKQNTAKTSGWLSAVVPLNGHSRLLVGPDDNQLSAETALGRNVQQQEKLGSFRICRDIGLDLDVHSKPEAKPKLDLRVLTRGVLFEMHQYVEQHCRRYVPALYEILEYNFDLSSQRHRRVEFAWSIAAQVMAVAAKSGREGEYLSRVFELPFEEPESSQVVCKEEPEDEPEDEDDPDVVFVRELKPVDIEVVID